MRQKNPVPHFLIQGILIQCLDCSGVPFLLSVIQIAHVHFRLFSVQEFVFFENEKIVAAFSMTTQ